MAKKRTRAAAPSKHRGRRVGPVAKSRVSKAARARSLASKKGWATRRAKQAARSAAAKKGWATRKRNAARLESRKRGQRRKSPIRRSTKRPTPSLATAEFAVSADYRARKRGSSVSVQIALRGPANATKAELETAVNHAIDHKGEAPPGYEIAIVDWRGNEYAGGPFKNAAPSDDPHRPWKTLGGPLSLATLEVSKIRKDEV